MFNNTLIGSYFSEVFGKESSLDLAVTQEKLINLSIESPSELLSALAKECFGLVGSARICPLKELSNDQQCCMVFYNDSWCLLQRSDSPNFVFIKDYNTLIESEVAFEDCENSIALWIHIEKEEVEESTASSIWHLLKIEALSKPRWLVNIALATLVINIFAVVTSLFAMQVYDRVVPSLAFDTLNSLVFGIFIIYAVDFLLKITRAQVLEANASNIDKKISKHIFSHLLESRIDKLPPQLGTLSAQISGFESVRNFASSSIVFCLVDLPFSLVFLSLIYIIAGKVAWIYAGFFVIALFVGFISQKASHKYNKEITQRSNEKSGLLVDTVRGGESIRSTNSSSVFLDRWCELNESVSTSSLIQKRISSIGTSTSQSLGSVAYALAIVLGVNMIAAGEITMGSMIACSILGGRVLGPVGQAVSYLIQFEGVSQSSALVDSFLGVTKTRSTDKLLWPSTKPGKIHLESLSFAYEGSSSNQVEIPDLTFTAGEKVAIVGGIGSGKSTFLKLIAGIIRTDEGRLKLDEINLWDIEPAYVAKHISYLPQTPALFRGSLRFNLSLGSSTSDFRISDVVRKLNLSGIYQNSDKGLEMELPEGGGSLSGGQKQMVGLARIFINKPTFWVLDEPTASLDPQTQALVIDRIKSELTAQDTLIFATHNLKLAKDLADRILVMENGRIVKDIPTTKVEVRRAAA